MDRRDFLAASGIGLGGLMIPGFGNAVAAEVLLTKMDPARKKVLADIALNAATSAGATYCDVRLGRYMRQFVITRENRVENVVNILQSKAHVTRMAISYLFVFEQQMVAQNHLPAAPAELREQLKGRPAR